MHHGSDFNVARRRDGDLAVVAPRGELDLATVDVLRDAAQTALAEAPAVVVDLREVTFMDSSGLRLLVELQRAADDDGVALSVVRGPAAVQRLLDLAGLDGRLNLVDDPADADRGGRADPA